MRRTPVTTLRLTPATTRDVLRRSRGAVKTVEELRAESKATRHLALAEPVLHPWYLRARPSPLQAFFGIGAGAARRVAKGEAWVVLDGGKPRARAGRVLSPVDRDEFLDQHRNPVLGTFSAGLEALWKTFDRKKPGSERSLREQRWYDSHAGDPPATLVTSALPVIASRAMTPGLLRRYEAVFKANANLTATPSDAHRRALFVTASSLWNALLKRVIDPPPFAFTGSVAWMDACVFDASVAPDACGLPAYVLRALFGQRVHDRLVVRGLARDLWDACNLLDAEPEVALDALDALSATHPVALVREAPESTDHVVALRPFVCAGDAVRLHPCHTARVSRDEELAPFLVLLPTTERARAELRALAAQGRVAAPTRVARLGLHLAGRAVEQDADAMTQWALGLEAADRSGLSLSIDDLVPAPSKAALVAEARAQVAAVTDQYWEGMITDDERYNKIVDLWAFAAERIAQELTQVRGDSVALRAMVESGAAGSAQNVRQMAGMRGLFAWPSGEIIPEPVEHNLREGVTPHEFMRVVFGARSGLVTANDRDARRAALHRGLGRALETQRAVIEDCGATRGLALRPRCEYAEDARSFAARLVGRTLAEDVTHPDTGAALAARGAVIDATLAEVLVGAELDAVTVRSPVACRARGGVCRVCLGPSGEREAHEGLAAALALVSGAAKIKGTRTFHVGC